VLDLFAHNRASDQRLGPFSPRALAELEKIAGLIAMAESSFENLAGAPVQLPGLAELDRESGDAERERALLMYQAGNRIAQAETEEAALAAVRQALAQTPYPNAILLAPDDGSGGLMRLAHRSDRDPIPLEEAQPVGLSAEQATRYFNRSTPALVADLESTGLPQALWELAHELGCKTAAFVPALRGGLVSALLVLGSSPMNNLEGENPSSMLPINLLGPYLTLVELLVASLEKIRAQRHTQRQLAELHTFWNVSQAISLETDLKPLFMTIHHQVESVIGELNSFAIAFYDGEAGTIEIPYMVEEGHKLEITPFPLGEGLTSILVRTRKPLLLAEDVEARSKALGAKIQGAPAKSWLGVPMIYSGEVIGAIIVQDINQEKRFSEQDERLLSALAAQVAVVVRNARLLEATRLQAQHEHLLNEITTKIRRSPDIQAILKTTASELGTALGVRRAYIRLGVEPEARTVETEAER
jgi:GAF domain-containing protein